MVENDDEPKVLAVNKEVLIFAIASITILGVMFFSFFLGLFLLTTFLGLFLGIESVKQELDIKSDFSNKFCNLTPKTDCVSIIKKSNFKLFGFVGLSDLSLIFFSGQILSITIFSLSNYQDNLILLTAISLLLTIPISIGSIYYQFAIKKKLCFICLGIVFILFLELFLFYFKINMSDFRLNKLSISIFLLFVFSFLLPLFILKFSKPLYVNLIKIKGENKSLSKFKRNYFTFKQTLIAGKKVSYKNLKSKINLGSDQAKLKITVITNPLCKFCRDTHLIIEELLKKHPKDIQINILFFFDSTNESEDLISNLHYKLLEIYLDKGEDDFLKALGNWFENKEYNKWFKRHGKISKGSGKYKDILRIQNAQNEENGIQFTPSMFIGGYQYPNTYEKKYIPMFIDDLLEDKDLLV